METSPSVSARDRVVAAYKGQFADCVPAYPIAGSFAGCLDGLSIEEYCTNPKKAVKAMLNYYDRYRPDIMIAFNDLAKEAEAIGCRVKYSDYVVPSIDQHVLQDDKGKLARLEVPDPKKAGRLPGFLEQCEALSSAKVPSPLGSVNVGPWTIAMLMRNPELLCLDTLDDPQFVHDLMRFCTEYAKSVGDAVLEQKIEAEVKRCIDTAGKRSRFVLSTSCELPPQASPDCVKWFMDFARDYGRYDRILNS